METLDVEKLAVELEAIVKPMQHHFSYRPGPSFTKAYYLHSRLLIASSLLRLYYPFH